MYNYNFECEKTLLEIVDNLATINDEELKVNILITEENLLLFKNIKEGNVLNSRGINEMPEYELIVKIKFNDIKYKIDEDNTIIELGKNQIILYKFDLSKVKTSLFCDKSVIY
ncbi:MAG: hypothetical protein E7161_00915 [Firmicutes bacterium]|nr:hypothetical protein [Bacillota bacterium]